ncbi:hypothetical protein N8751_00430 [bacterium]|nr:hypothetical protein [bacterium]
MPNLCWNHLTIICQDDNKQIEKMYNDEFIKMKDIHVETKTLNGLQISVPSAWEPLNLHTILSTYNKCWIKNEWEDEGGTCGIFIGGFLNNEVVDKTDINWTDLSIEGKYHYLKKAWYK